MKKIGCCLIICLMMVPALSADTYIRETTHTDPFYYGGVQEPASDRVTEIWFDGNRLAYMTPGRTVIIDATAGLISIANRNNKTYVQTELPLDMKKIVPPEIYALLETRQTTGQVSETGQKKTIDSRECQGYDIQVDQPYALEIKNWCTPDVPFDWKRLHSLFHNILRLGNYSPGYIEEHDKMKGFSLASDVTIFLQGVTFGSRSRVLEITEKEPPPEIYTVPPGYEKKDLLSIEDIRNR